MEDRKEQKPVHSRVLHFYHEKGPYGELSNFYPVSPPIEYNNKKYPTSEHLFQSMKYLGPEASERHIEYADLIRTASTPYKSKILANQQRLGRFKWQQELCQVIDKYQDLEPRQDWDDVCDEAMLTCLRLKFQNNVHCKKVLMSTGDSMLAEHTTRDIYWADGGDGTGQNMLGKLLVKVRDELFSKKASKHTDGTAEPYTEMKKAKLY